MPRTSTSLCFTAGLLFLLGWPGSGSTQVPSLVMSDHATVDSSLTKGVSRVSANARGDVFFADPGNTRIVEIAAGTTTPVPLLTGIKVGSSGTAPDGVSVDSSGNVYVADAYDGRVIRIPFVNGSYPANISVSTLDSAAPTPTVCTAGLQVDCTLPTTTAAALGYYMQASDVTMDAAGDFFFVDIDDGISAGKYNRIVELTASGTVKIVADNLTSVATAQIASDSAGDLYYAMGQGSGGTTLFTIPAGSTNASLTAISSSLKSPTGVTFDQAGNLIVSDSGNSRIVVVPYLSGALSFSELYVLTPQYSQNSVGIDSFGTIYYTGASSGSTSVNAAYTSVYYGGLIPVLNSAAAFTIQASFNTTATLSKLNTQAFGANVTTSVGSCVLGTTYTATQSCSINLSITPTKIGPVSGAVGIQTSTGAVLGQFAYSAIGEGSAATLDPGTPTASATLFSKPAGVTVDGAGNVFVADTTANLIYELPGGTGTAVALGTGLNGPTAVAVDSAGDLFIADTGNARVVEIPNLGGSYSASSQRTIASGLTAPLALAIGPLDSLYIAEAGQLARYDIRGLPTALTTVLSTSFARPEALTVDHAGNLYIADAATGDVSEIATYTNAVTTVATGLTLPTGLATDPAGDLFLADNGTASVVRIPVSNGSLSFANAISAGTFTSPFGLALDAAGNLYVTDPGKPTLYQVNRSSGLLSFGNINIGSTSSALSATIVSSGNATTSEPTLGTPVYTASGSMSDFSIGSSNTCTAGEVLAPASSCLLAATFKPAASGTVSEDLSIAFTSLGSLSLTLTGDGRYLASTTTTVALTSPSGSLTYGEAATFTATVTPSSINNNASPIGTVTFTINGVAQKPVSLGTNDTASIQTSALSGGTNVITASYSGDSNYQPSTSSSFNATVARATTTTTLTLTTAYTNPTSSSTGTSMTFTAIVTPSIAGQLDGQIAFASGSTTLGTATLSATTSGTYQAALTTSSVPVGNYSVTAAYSGNTNYSGSTSAAQSLIVSSPGIQLTSGSSTITSSTSSAGSVTLSVASVAGLTAPVTFACNGLPTWAVCYFTPAYISLASSTPASPVAPTAVNLSIGVSINPGQSEPVVSQWNRASSTTALALLLGVPFLASRRRRRRWFTLSLAVLLSLLTGFGLVGCGSPTSFTTPTGTSTVTVTATSSTATASLTLNLTVTQ